MSAGGAWRLRAIPRATARLWWGQKVARRLARDMEPGGVLMGVCARQVGKTVVGTEIVVGDALEDPGGHSCILVPTYRIGLVQAMRLKALGEGVLGGRWRKQDGYLELPNGHLIWLRSADKEDAIRGLTLTRWLWTDEAAMVKENAHRLAGATLLTSRHGRTLVTTTPKGKASWVYRDWTSAEDPPLRFALRACDSPFVTPRQLERQRAQMGGALAQQELDAVFLDEGATPFPPELVERLLVAGLRRRGKRLVLGVDFAKEHDYVVVTLMNEFGEAWILGRWRHVAWPDTEKAVADYARETGALLVAVDNAQAGGTMADYLERALGRERIHRVNTNVGAVKQSLVEELQADAQHGRVVVDASGPFADDLRHELLFLVPRRKIVHGVERINYGPSSEEDHDDTVTSLSLANAARRHLEDQGEGPLDGFVRQPGASAPRATMWGGPPTPGTARGGWGQEINLGRRS